MDILAIEPWYGGSHQRFLDGLAACSAHTVRLVTMEGCYWRWRLEGSAVTMARKAGQVLDEGFRPDLLFASDMLNVPAFLALAPPRLRQVSLVLYFHENQLTYPLPEGRARERSYAFINYLSALAAERVAFNSQFHFDVFTEALSNFLGAYPDHPHAEEDVSGDTISLLREKSQVLHVGMDLEAHDCCAPADVRHTRPDGSPIVLWNQRWAYDKNPAAFFRVMNRLDDAGYRFRLILAGECIGDPPPVFERALERYGDRVLHYGYAEAFDAYSRLLHRADIVVSTAIHEFFGIAVLEAIRCGCHPLLPNRLSYPELIPDTLHEASGHAPILYDDEETLFRNLGRLLDGDTCPLPPSTLHRLPEALDWRTHAARYDALFEQVASSAARAGGRV